jgi:hypothetical protein
VSPKSEQQSAKHKFLDEEDMKEGKRKRKERKSADSGCVSITSRFMSE